MQSKKLTMQRLMKEEASLDKQPIAQALVTRKGLLNFHFCLHDLEGPFAGGFYHGLLELHQNYPFAAPKLIFYTPSGRFDINMPICTSFTNYHQESWTSAWNVRTLILATISFMYSDEPSYGCRQDSHEARVAMARSSLQHNFKNPEFVELFGDKLAKMGITAQSKIKPVEQIKEPQGEDNYTAYVHKRQDILLANQEERQLGHLVDEDDKGPDRHRNNRQFWVTVGKGACAVVVVGIVIFVVYKLQ